jgi:hypothetical protein
MDEIGPTGRRTRPPISPDDRGELRGALYVDVATNSLILRLGENVSWLAMTRDEALALAAGLTAHAAMLKP